MTNADTPWPIAAKEMCASLADGLDVAGTVETADIFTRIGATCLEVVIEASDNEGEEQADSYRVLCDLLDTRLSTGPADEIFGCLLFATEPDPEALIVGLTHMTRPGGMFVPVLPLSRDQVYAIAGSPASLADFTDDVTALIQATVAGDPPGLVRAQTLLEEFDELIARSTQTSN